MIKDLKETVKNVFLKNGGYAHSRELYKSGITNYAIGKLEKENYIVRIKKGFYRLSQHNYFSEYNDIFKLIPKGVICLVSALSLHNLTTSTPTEYHIAVERDTKVKIPDYPPIKVYYFSDKYYSEEITQVDFNGEKLTVYSMEKSICDCFRFRKRIGKDILLESLKEYSRRKDKNVSKLMKYARASRVEKQIKQYMEAFLYE